jgi:hypothetical protein
MRAVGAVDRTAVRCSSLAVVSLVDNPANHRKTTAVAKKVMTIKYMNTANHSITKFLESPFAGKHSKLMRKGTKAAAAAESAMTATEAIVVADT